MPEAQRPCAAIAAHPVGVTIALTPLIPQKIRVRAMPALSDAAARLYASSYAALSYQARVYRKNTFGICGGAPRVFRLPSTVA